MHPLILFVAVRDEQARRTTQASLERAARTRPTSSDGGSSETRRSIGTVGARLAAAIGRRIRTVTRGRAGAA
jgi:hypothetical protein